MTTNLTLPRLDLEEDTGAGNEMWFESRQAPKDLLQLYKRDPTKLSLNERWFCNDNYMAYTSELARLATEKIKDTSYAGKNGHRLGLQGRGISNFLLWRQS